MKYIQIKAGHCRNIKKVESVMIRFSALLPISAPFRISAPLRMFVNKRPHSAKRPYPNIIMLE